MSNFDKVDLAYDFLVSRERNQESFTIDELAAATGWKVQTCKTYPTKTWSKFISRDGKHYTTLGIKYISKEDFRHINTQKYVDSIPQSERSINLKKQGSLHCLQLQLTTTLSLNSKHLVL